MVDVGDGAGALVIYTSEALRGQEIDISVRGEERQGVHTDVLRRKTAQGFVCAAVFGSLQEGDYMLWHQSLPGPAEVHIGSGEVVELDWR